MNVNEKRLKNYDNYINGGPAFRTRSCTKRVKINSLSAEKIVIQDVQKISPGLFLNASALLIGQIMDVVLPNLITTDKSKILKEIVDILPTLTTFSISMLSSQYTIGNNIGSMVLLSKLLIDKLLPTPLPDTHGNVGSGYEKFLNSSSMYHLVYHIPLLEETARAIVQDVITRIARVILGTTNSSATTTDLLSTTLGIIGSGLSFGLAHLTNQHNGRYNQAFLATIHGIINSILQTKIGFFASLGSHASNNLVAVLGLRLKPLDFG